MGAGFFAKLFGTSLLGAGKASRALPELEWTPAERNPWRVPILDVRPMTGMLALARDPRAAANAVSFGDEDGRCFIGKEPPSTRRTAASLTYRRDGLLADGALFLPTAMEHKWAIFHHAGTLIFVRSWERRVAMTAHVEQRDDLVHLTEIRGALRPDQPDDGTTPRVIDYLIRTHALDLEWPVPLPDFLFETTPAAGFVCSVEFGSLARVATPHEVRGDLPEQPLRSRSLLHFAVLRDDTTAAEAQLRAGVPVDLRCRDGFPSLHLAVLTQRRSMLDLLLAHGAHIDVRSDDGSTPLMVAVEHQGGADHVEFLLSHGADTNARDERGFTALHRSAEVGNLRDVRLLLAHGADSRVDAHGHTPLSLAKMGGHEDIVALMS